MLFVSPIEEQNLETEYKYGVYTRRVLRGMSLYDQATLRPIQIFAIKYDYWYVITKTDGDLEEGEQPKLNENGEQYMIAWTDCGYFESYMQLRFGGLMVKSAIESAEELVGQKIRWENSVGLL
ncbi:hypothetical protein [Chitinophaga sp. CF418]|uniref:hypothetical protein n=1 Tax=Chitinophaga sp. CF418 TaxID=1855287 RepID=UPI000920CEA7|nr:hypothetical protein [Chitinophaga sp. CF418]SHM76140.1 hypothetical protein SAMN05216311_103178 [Chitinophaga sp. CF418]